MIKEYLDCIPERKHPGKTSRQGDVEQFLASGRNVAEICTGGLDPVSVRTAYVFCVKSMGLEQSILVTMRNKRIFLIRKPAQ